MAIHTFAAIYIGSYEVSLKIFEISARKNIRKIDYIRSRIELGRDAYSRGVIGYELVEALCDTLREFAQIMKEYRVDAYEAYASAVLRDVDNELFILDQIRLRTGLNVRVLSNSEHRFISYKSVAMREEFEHFIGRSAAVVDVSGSGLQITVFSKGKVLTTQHLGLGTMRMREQLAKKSRNLAQYELQIEEMVVKEMDVFKGMYLENQEIEYLIVIGDYIAELVCRLEKNRNKNTVSIEKFVQYMEQLGKKSLEEIGAPEGTTFIVRKLFYNVPARRKFLKTAQTEAGYISDLMERMALSHPDVSFKFINNGQTKLHTSGNGNEKDLIYHIYGRDITAAVLKVEHETELFKLRGFIGKPIISRGNRNYENYFINGRYIKSALIAKSIEEAYKGFMMQHQYPFCVLYFEMNSELLDVNVHPTKMELRFSQNEEIYRSLFEIIRNTISHRDFIPEVPVTEEKKEMIPPVPKHTPEPFEIRRRGQDAFFEKMKQTSASPLTVQEENLFAKPLAAEAKTNTSKEPIAEINSEQPTLENNFKEIVSEIHDIESTPQETAPIYEQQNLEQLDSHFLTKDARKKHKIIGQLFDTYWLIEYEDKLFIIDQHAAHEKVLYERTMKKISEKTFTSQTISPPIILTLNQDEVQALETYEAQLSMFGYEIEPFGGKEYAITAIPADFTDIDMKTMFIEMLDDFANISGKDAPNLIMEKVASMSCKAAVKGNNHLSRPEIEALIDELLELDNPYNCPHGRPTIISMTKYEIEKKFRRIV